MDADLEELRREVQHRRLAFVQLSHVFEIYRERTTPALVRGERALALLHRCVDVVPNAALRAEIDTFLRG